MISKKNRFILGNLFSKDIFIIIYTKIFQYPVENP